MEDENQNQNQLASEPQPQNQSMEPQEGQGQGQGQGTWTWTIPKTQNEKAWVVGQVFNLMDWDLVTFDELKRLRQVCRAWEIFIACSPRFVNATLQVNKQWHQDHTRSKYQVDSPVAVGFFENVKITGCPLRHSYFKMTYWPGASRSLTSLTLYRIKLRCEELTGMISACGALKKLTLEGIRIRPVTQQSDVEGLQWNHCSHGPDLVALPAGPYEPPQCQAPGDRLSEVIIKATTRVPLCTLNHLGSRVHGSLTSLQLGDPENDYWFNTFPPEGSRNTSTLLYDWVTKVAHENVETVEILQVFTHGWTLDDDGHLPELPVFPSLQSFGGNTTTCTRVTSHIPVNELVILILSSFDAIFWELILLQPTLIFPNLTSFKIYRGHCPRGVSVIPLPGFDVDDLRLQPKRGWNQMFPKLKNLVADSPGYDIDTRISPLTTLPSGLLELRVRGPIRPEALRAFMTRGGEPQVLTTLSLSQSFRKPLAIDNLTFQLLIESFPQLQVLTLHSMELTDDGILGGQGQGRNLRELTRLRYLDLNGCRSLTDQAIFEAIGQLTQLTFLALNRTQVTDAGMGFVVQNCRGLVELELYLAQSVRLDGLHDLVRNLPTLKSIFIDKDILRQNRSGNPLDPKLKKVLRFRRARRIPV